MSSTVLPNSLSFSSSRALYAPPALHSYALLQDAANPKDIALERYRQRLNLHKHNDDPSPHRVHRHFLTKARDRRLAVHEGVGDIRDAVAGMDNVADAVFIGFVIRPEWDLSKPLDPTNIELEVITSHHIKQHPEYQRVVDELHKTIQQRVAFAHVYSYHKRLHAVTPGYGYAMDSETGRLRDNEIQLAPGIQPPLCMDQRRGVVSTATGSRTQSVPAASSSSPTHHGVSSARAYTTRPASRSTIGQQETTSQLPSRFLGSQSSAPAPVRIQTSRGLRWVRPGTGTRREHSHSVVDTPTNPIAGGIRSAPVAVQAASVQRGQVVELGTVVPRFTGTSTQVAADTTTIVPPSSMRTTRPTQLVPNFHNAATSIPSTPMSQQSEPIVVSDSDSEGSAIESLLSTSDSDSVQNSDVESWVHTPDGSPLRRASLRHHTPPMPPSLPAMNEALPPYPPPEYSEYLQTTVESFGFHPVVAAFLATRNLSPAGLVRIDSTLNYHLGDWTVGFLEAGLSEADAQQLRAIVIQTLPDLTRDALITAWAAEDN